MMGNGNENGIGNGGEDEPIKGDEDQTWDAPDADPLETERLALDDEEERLPWLESGDDELESYDGVDNGRMIGFVFAGLIALAAIVGGIWWATNRTTDPALVADGSVISAPEAPASEKPKDPGGKTFDGTGDTSFAVSEGQARPAHLGGDANSAPVKPAAGAEVKPSISVGPVAPEAGAVGVQIGAFSSNAAAEAAWTKLAQQNSALSGVRHRVVQGSADIGTVYRLQAVAGDTAAANALCGKLKAGGLSCQVK